MALQKLVVNETNGQQADYWKILHFKDINLMNGRLTFYLGGFLDENFRRTAADPKPVTHREFNVDAAELGITPDKTGDEILTILYQYIKGEVEWQDAVDVLEV